MRTGLKALCAAAALLLAVPLVAEEKSTETTKTSPVTTEQIAQWVRQLGDDDFNVREQAQQSLLKQEAAAKEAVTAATKSGDQETALRAQAILDAWERARNPLTTEVLDQAGKMVFRISDRGTIQASRTTDGARIWETRVGQQPVHLELKEGRLTAATQEGQLFVIDPATGRLLSVGKKK